MNTADYSGNSELDEAQRRQQAADWLMIVRNERATDAQVSTWLRWIQADPRNLETFETVSALAHGLRTLSPKMKIRLSRELLGSAHRVERSRHSAATYKRVTFAGLAAVLALLVFGAFHFTQLGRLASPGNGKYVTVRGETRNLVLSDGTLVALAPDSEMRVDFTSQKRMISLKSGEVYLQVKHDRHRPFQVDVAGYRVTDIGTAFDVRNSGGYVTVAVMRGAVDLNYLGNRGQSVRPAEIMLQPLRLVSGEDANVRIGVLHPAVTPIDSSEVASWREGRLRFRDAPLSVVVDNINRYSERQIVIIDPSVKDMHYTGTVYVDQVGEWLQAVCGVFDLQESVQDKGREVLLNRTRQ